VANNGDEVVKVTDENFGELLIEGLEEALEVARGEQEPAHKTKRPIPPGRDGPLMFR
jgi:hypothetical protein